MAIMLGLQLLAAGCAPGYYERREGYEPDYQRSYYYNYPETREEYDMRIWQEEKGR